MSRQTEPLLPLPSDVGAVPPTSAHLGDMLDSLSDGFMSIDKSWHFAYLNQTAERNLQHARENLLGRDIWECYPDLVDSDYGRVYRQTAATGLPGRHTGYYAPLCRWFEARSFAHDDGITVLFRDVTREQEHAAQREFEARNRAPERGISVSGDAAQPSRYGHACSKIVRSISGAHLR